MLLERLELTGALVTIDAVGTQNAITEIIVRRGGDYLLTLKANRPATFADVACFFDNLPPGMVQGRHDTTDADLRPWR